jgi:hypothetical protein
MAKNITINFKTVYDDKGIKSATMSLSDLEKVAKNVQKSVDAAGAKMAASWAVMAEGFGRVNDMIQKLAASYANAELNATRLEVIMRQRMKSTDEEIASIKRLTSAQADLGIISAGVQRAGAQQLATFLYQKSSLEVLIPAMNNLVAQQRGFNAEAGDAVGVANLMGKAMMGQTSALRRVGITFTEAQEAAIKNGNEQERAAMLAQIITDNVGEMNAALAKTDAGKQKQLANSMGALKAKIGSFVSSIAPAMSVGAAVFNIAAGWKAMAAAVKTAAMGYWGLTTKLYTATTAMLANSRAAKVCAAFMSKAGISARAFGVAIRGIMAASGVGLVLWGISAAFSALTGKADEAAEKQREAAEEAARVRKEYEQWKRSLTDVGQATGEYAAKELSAVEQLYKKATDLAGTYKERHAAARQLINDYPTYLGQLSEEAIMTGKAAAQYKKLCDNILQAAEARAIQKKIEDNYAEIIANEETMKGYEWANDPKIKADQKKLYQGAVAAADAAEKEMRETGLIKVDPVTNTIYREKRSLAEINAARVKAFNQYYAAHATEVGGNDYRTVKATQDEYARLQQRNKDLRAANTRLSARASNIHVDPVIERGAGGHTPTKTAPTKPEKPYTPPANLNEIQSYEELSKAVQYYNKVKDAATTDADRLKAQQSIDTLEDMRKAWDAASSTAKAYEPPKDIADIRSVDQANEALTHYRNAYDAATDDAERQRLQGIIDKIEALKKSWTGTTETVKADIPRWRSTLDEIRADLDRIYALPPKLWKVEVKGMGFEALTKQIRALEKMKYMPGVSAADLKNIDETIARLQQMRAASLSGMETFSGMWDATKGLQGGIRSMTKVTDENATAWEKVSAVVDGAMQMYQAVAQIIQIVDAVITASSATKKSTSAANVAASNAEATADTTAAAASMFKAHAWLPWVGVGLGAAAVATMLATMFSLPKYAQGGIAYGPTVGMFGEYANASTNPEVVAPLDRLRTLIQPQGSLGGEVEFKIEGRTLRGILNKVDNHNSRI